MVFQSSFGKISYAVLGEENETTIALFHVLGSDMNFFKRQIDELSAKYRILLWDMPWHGQSVRPDRELDFNTIEAAFIELLDYLGIERLILSGVSLGGFVSYHIAARNPDRVEALHLDGAHPLHMNFGRFISVLSVLHSLVLKSLPLKLISVMAGAMLSTDKPSKIMIRDFFRTFERRHLIHLAEGSKKSIMRGAPDTVKCPVLMTNGENDFKFIRKRCIKWHEANAERTSYVTVTGGGHLHLATHPSAFTSALLRFVESLRQYNENPV